MSWKKILIEKSNWTDSLLLHKSNFDEWIYKMHFVQNVCRVQGFSQNLSEYLQNKKSNNNAEEKIHCCTKNIWIGKYY